MSDNRGGLPPSEELMALRVGRHGRAVVVTVSGEIDVLTAPRLANALAEAFAEAPAGPVVLDLTDVAFLASRGLSTIVDAHREARAPTPLRVVVDYTRPVIRPLQITGLDSILTLFDTLDDALAGEPEVDVSTDR